MDKVAGMAKTSARGSFKLFIGVSISSVITAVSVILVMAFLKTESDFGLVAIAMTFPALITLFKDWGINSAMVRYLAQYRSENNTDGAKNVMVAGLVFELLTGAVLTLLSFFLAGYLATNVFGTPEAKGLIEIASLTIITDSFFKVSQATFTGLERLEFYSMVQILNASIRCFLAPLLVFLGFGVLGAIEGQVTAQFVAGVFGILIFYLKFLRQTGKNVKIKLKMFGTAKTLIKYGMPLSVSGIAGGFLPQFFNTLLAKSALFPTEEAYKSAMGNYNAAVNFAVIMTFFTTPITTVLFPAFSKLKVEHDRKSLQVIFRSSVKYGALLTIPVALMVIVLAEPLVYSLVKTIYVDAPLFLMLYSMIYLYSAVGNLSVGALLNGQGRTDITMRISLVTMGLGVVLGLLLIIPFGVVGLLVTTLIAPLASTVYGLWWIKKHFGATVDWGASAKIFLASCIAAAVTHLILSQFTAGYWIELVVGAVAFVCTYFVVAPLIRAIDKNDVSSLREMFSGLGFISYLFEIPFKVIEKILDIF